jgi:hypothetical protein
MIRVRLAAVINVIVPFYAILNRIEKQASREKDEF